MSSMNNLFDASLENAVGPAHRYCKPEYFFESNGYVKLCF